MKWELDKSKYKDWEEKGEKVWFGDCVNLLGLDVRRATAVGSKQIIAGAGTLPSMDRRRSTEYVGNNAYIIPGQCRHVGRRSERLSSQITCHYARM